MKLEIRDCVILIRHNNTIICTYNIGAVKDSLLLRTILKILSVILIKLSKQRLILSLEPTKQCQNANSVGWNLVYWQGRTSICNIVQFK